MHAGAVLFNDLYASTHILNSIRAAIGSHVNRLVTCSRGRRSQRTRRSSLVTGTVEVQASNGPTIYEVIKSVNAFAINAVPAAVVSVEALVNMSKQRKCQ